MTTLTRKIKRAAFRKNAVQWEGQQAQYRDLPNGGYMALHPTKGWKRTSARRVRAQSIMANHFGFVR